ncbi:MAG: hypothetical protein LC624_03045 [Halobacteriales archaeon]|nr:hypothetical protein [Halobacteriales archaeon]
MISMVQRRFRDDEVAPRPGRVRQTRKDRPQKVRGRLADKIRAVGVRGPHRALSKSTKRTRRTGR